MKNHGCGAGMAGEVVVNFLKVFGSVAVSPENEFERATAVAGFFVFELAEIRSRESAATGAVIDLNADFKFDHVARLEDSGFASRDKRFRPEHDFTGAGEVLDRENTEWFPSLGRARLDRADHTRDWITLAWIIELDFID